MKIPEFEINIGNFRVYSLSDASSIIVGRGSFKNTTSNSKTNNGVGNVYGDGSDITMNPKNLTINDQDNFGEVINEHEQASSATIHHAPDAYSDLPDFYTPNKHTP